MIRLIFYLILFLLSILVFFTGFADVLIHLGWTSKNGDWTNSFWVPTINWVLIDYILMIVGMFSSIAALEKCDPTISNK